MVDVGRHGPGDLPAGADLGDVGRAARRPLVASDRVARHVRDGAIALEVCGLILFH